MKTPKELKTKSDPHTNYLNCLNSVFYLTKINKDSSTYANSIATQITDIQSKFDSFCSEGPEDYFLLNAPLILQHFMDVIYQLKKPPESLPGEIDPNLIPALWNIFVMLPLDKKLRELLDFCQKRFMPQNSKLIDEICTAPKSLSLTAEDAMQTIYDGIAKVAIPKGSKTLLQILKEIYGAVVTLSKYPDYREDVLEELERLAKVSNPHQIVHTFVKDTITQFISNCREKIHSYNKESKTKGSKKRRKKNKKALASLAGVPSAGPTVTPSVSGESTTIEEPATTPLARVSSAGSTVAPPVSRELITIEEPATTPLAGVSSAGSTVTPSVSVESTIIQTEEKPKKNRKAKRWSIWGENEKELYDSIGSQNSAQNEERKEKNHVNQTAITTTLSPTKQKNSARESFPLVPKSQNLPEYVYRKVTLWPGERYTTVPSSEEDTSRDVPPSLSNKTDSESTLEIIDHQRGKKISTHLLDYSKDTLSLPIKFTTLNRSASAAIEYQPTVSQRSLQEPPSIFTTTSPMPTTFQVYAPPLNPLPTTTYFPIPHSPFKPVFPQSRSDNRSIQQLRDQINAKKNFRFINLYGATDADLEELFQIAGYLAEQYHPIEVTEKIQCDCERLSEAGLIFLCSALEKIIVTKIELLGVSQEQLVILADNLKNKEKFILQKPLLELDFTNRIFEINHITFGAIKKLYKKNTCLINIGLNGMQLKKYLSTHVEKRSRLNDFRQKNKLFFLAELKIYVIDPDNAAELRRIFTRDTMRHLVDPTGECLQYAAKYGKEDCIKCLLELAGPEDQENLEKAYENAIEYNYREMANVILACSLSFKQQHLEEKPHRVNKKEDISKASVSTKQSSFWYSNKIGTQMDPAGIIVKWSSVGEDKKKKLTQNKSDVIALK